MWDKKDNNRITPKDDFAPKPATPPAPSTGSALTGSTPSGSGRIVNIGLRPYNDPVNQARQRPFPFGLAAAGIFVLALAVRLLHVLQIRHAPARLGRIEFRLGLRESDRRHCERTGKGNQDR